MSSAALRSLPHAPSPSPSYVPRSRPGSPSLPPPPAHLPANPHHAYPHAHNNGRGHSRSASLPGSPVLNPRLADMERRGSSNLRHEVGAPPPTRGQAKEMSEGARAILKALANLPAPLPEQLPTTFLPTPNTTPSPPAARSFTDYVHRSSPGTKRPHADIKEVGLGLGLSMSNHTEGKKRKLSHSPPPSASSATFKAIPPSPSLSRSSSIKSPELHRSSSTSRLHDKGAMDMRTSASFQAGLGARASSKSNLRKEVGEVDEDKGSWTREKWKDLGADYRSRALLLKRHGDAYSRVPSAKAEYTSVLARDPIRGLLCLTDAVLLWLYAYWCEEQGSTRVRSSPYNESQPLREFVRKQWESEMRRADDDERREMARAMVGLMHLIEAVINYHLTTESLVHLSRTTKNLSQVTPSSASTHGPSPSSSSNSPPSGLTNPSPAAQSSHSASGINSSSPDSHTSQTLTDLLPIITSSTATSSRATMFLLNSRHHLSLRILRTRFPDTFEYAINSDLSDEALPAPGDTLGAAKRLDVDEVERFAWPIELGMQCPTAHTAVFGRCMVAEFGKTIGGYDTKVLA